MMRGTQAEIHFVWIEEFRCFKRQPFNLSGRFSFSIDDGATQVTVRDNPRYVDRLWKHDNVLNVSALVGQNGAGKSTFLEFILDTFPRFAGVPDPRLKRFMVAVERGGEGFLLFNHLPDGAIQIEDLTTNSIWQSCVHFPHDMRSNSVFGSYFDDMHFVFYSNEFNSGHLPSSRADDGPNDHVHDLSTRYLVSHDAVAFSNLPSSPPHPVVAHGNMETLRNVDFALRCEGGEDLLGFRLPDELRVAPLRFAREDFPEELRETFSRSNAAVSSEPKEGFLDRLALSALHNYAKDTQSPRILDTLQQLSTPTTTFDAVIESFHQTSSAYGPAPGLRVQLLEYCRDELPDDLFRGVGEWLTFPIRNATIKEQLKEFYALYSRSVMITPYVVERWGRPVSSGEQCLWNLYSRLWSFREGKPSER